MAGRFPAHQHSAAAAEAKERPRLHAPRRLRPGTHLAHRQWMKPAVVGVRVREEEPTRQMRQVSTAFFLRRWRHLRS